MAAEHHVLVVARLISVVPRKLCRLAEIHTLMQINT
jgi:hypothetical protein